MVRKQKKIKNQIIITYSLFVVVLITVLGFFFYLYNLRLLESREYQNMQNIAEYKLMQMESLIKDMDYVTIEAIYNRTIIDKLTSDAGVAKTSDEILDVHVRDELLLIESFRRIINNRITRITVLNNNGKIFTTDKTDFLQTDYNEVLDQAWLEELINLKGKKYIEIIDSDRWNKKSQTKKIAFSRLIRSSDIGVGYIETQKDFSEIEDIFYSSLGYKFIIHDSKNQLIYASDDLKDADIDKYISWDSNEIESDKYLIYKGQSDYLEWGVIALRDISSKVAEIRIFRNLTIIAGMLLLLSSILFIIFVSRVLTKPITRLVSHINDLSVDNYVLPNEYTSKYSETNKLNEAFNSLYIRLDKAIKDSYRFQNMQLKAHFDVLQAQINPHFMYNTLGIIANMGDEAKQYDISDACTGLIEMLRYSNDINTKETTIKDEVEHTLNYLKLMKIRYEYRLDYSINIDKRLYDVRIPKLIFQPLVENSIQHGYKNVEVSTMKIDIIGNIVGDRFEIIISDNGSGFEKEVLDKLNIDLESYKDKILSHSDLDALTMGGMGILSTFARLLIFYKDEFMYKIQNNNTGMSIIFSGHISDGNDK
jgi:two-component system sensor histidine kinase YesM